MATTSMLDRPEATSTSAEHGAAAEHNQSMSTLAVHAGEARQKGGDSITDPIYQASTYTFESTQAVSDFIEQEQPREEYGRYGNPGDINPALDCNIVGPTGVFSQAEFDSDGEFRKAASIMKLVVNGFAGAGTVTAHPVIMQSDLQRSIDRFRAGVGEERVIHPFGHHRGQPARQLERLGVGELEIRGVVQLVHLFLHRLDNQRITMARIDAPQARSAVHDPATIRTGVIHPLGGLDHAGLAKEITICRKWHPE